MFGRKKVADEDPFAALNQGGTYQSTPTTTIAGIPGSGLADEPVIVPSAAPTPVAPAALSPTTEPTISSTFTGSSPIPTPLPAPPTPTPTAPPGISASRRSTMRSMRGVRITSYSGTSYGGRGGWIASLIVLGVIAAIVVPIISSASHAIHSFTIPGFSVPSPSFTTPATPAAPRPPHATNYLKPAAVRAGLKRILKRFPGARVTNLRLDGSSMDAFVYPGHGGVKDLTMGPSGTFVTSGSGTGETPIAISAIPVGAVSRIVSGLKHQFHVPASRIDYMVLTTIPNLPPRWITFSKAPSHPGYAADLDGSGLQKLGG